ncbi:hypothetical protein OG946_20710 [Streptomyces sp. NBC_01808]|uniref:hypothetical protein n=1 Tax=Streptomyces sp. NBC_01808 TaxID=2975947 RepID=UPI002DDB80E2|nr:hypothetical protein [Streptomyces sp. NBC_01808]WSA39571.1 hypothetical protein OG946_20710 [Streptomyces sp. NBC_01808]
MSAAAGDVTAPRTYPSSPVFLPVREGQVARPVLDCEGCSRLDQERRDARNRGGHSAASDCSVLIRRHPHH